MKMRRHRDRSPLRYRRTSHTFHPCDQMAPLATWFLLLLLISSTPTESLSIRRFKHLSQNAPLGSYLRSSAYINGQDGPDSLSHIETKPTDSLERFEQDVTEVLRDLRPSAIDPTLPSKSNQLLAVQSTTLGFSTLQLVYSLLL